VVAITNSETKAARLHDDQSSWIIAAGLWGRGGARRAIGGEYVERHIALRVASTNGGPVRRYQINPMRYCPTIMCWTWLKQSFMSSKDSFGAKCSMDPARLRRTRGTGSWATQ
jgi:hypothetical protein